MLLRRDGNGSDCQPSYRPEFRDYITPQLDSCSSHDRWMLSRNSGYPSGTNHLHGALDEGNGRFPFETLPRDYKAAVTKFGKTKLEANGLLPWQIGVYSKKLTEALKDGKWEEAKLDAAILANYVAEAHDPSTRPIILTVT